MAKRKLSTTEADVDGIRKTFIETLHKESDRGCVLVATAMIDEGLEVLLREYMTADEKAIKACVEPLFVGFGPLKSFWAKTQLARALGLVDDWMYADMERIRKLRNLFAHSYQRADFDDPRVIALTDALVGADKAVQSFSNKPAPAKLVPIEPQPTLGRTARKRKQVLKKERLRFTLATSYIGGRIYGKMVVHRNTK